MMKTLRSQRASTFLFLAVTLFASCSRFQTKEKKKPYNFEVYVPIEEDYPLLSKGAYLGIETLFPNAKITLKEGLSDKYSIAPFEDWITKADSEGILRLEIHVERNEDIAPILTFLRKEESLIPFKTKIPKPSIESSEIRGEALFCKMRIEGADLYEKQLCRELYNALCVRESKTGPRKTILGNGASCQLNLFRPQQAVPNPLKTKLFLLAGFPLPVKLKNDYPLVRFGDADESVLLSLFEDTDSE